MLIALTTGQTTGQLANLPTTMVARSNMQLRSAKDTKSDVNADDKDDPKLDLAEVSGHCLFF